MHLPDSAPDAALHAYPEGSFLLIYKVYTVVDKKNAIWDVRGADASKLDRQDVMRIARYIEIQSYPKSVGSQPVTTSIDKSRSHNYVY